MKRISTHRMETMSCDWFRVKIDELEESLFREVSERDYGVDGIIELFSDGMPTGNIALVQIKSTGNKLVPMKTMPCISCPITGSNGYYALQNNIAVFLVYISNVNNKQKCCYYVNLQEAIKNIDLKKLEQENFTVHIPEEQFFEDSAKVMIEAIKAFYAD